jgi:S-adenosylmethionine:tRNA ribosyltransferase-isomerase
MTFDLQSYNYHLPEHLIAQQLASPADSCRLMVVDQWEISHQYFTDISDHLDVWDLLIFNDSKVVPARVALTSADIITHKTGKNISFIVGEAEIFFLRQYGDTTFEALVRRGKRFKTWSTVQIGNYKLTIGEVTQAGRMISVADTNPLPVGVSPLSGGMQGDHNIVLQFLHDHGTIPLPPYIADDASKYDDYQPIVAKQEGSVAAPTAALHFTDRLLQQLSDQWIQQASVTLHIGIGTFRLIDVADVRDHEIHREVCQISTWLFTQIAHTHLNNNKITVVWTTSCRTIESLPYLYLHACDQIILDPDVREYWDSQTRDLVDPGFIVCPLVMWDQIQRETQLYMYPWFQPKILDHLVTNFHLPQSTLLLMIASLIWYDLLIKCYEIAIQHEYQFYSFGDGMLLKNIRL